MHVKDDWAQLQKRHERCAMLLDYSTVLYATEPQSTTQRIVEEAVRFVRGQCGCLAMLNPVDNMLEVVAAMGLPKSAELVRFGVDDGIAGRVARTGKPKISGDLEKELRHKSLPEGMRSLLAAPVLMEDGVRGVLLVASRTVDAFTAEDLEMLVQLTHISLQAIRISWQFERNQMMVRLLGALVTLSQTINTTLDLDEVLRLITRESCALMGAKMSSILLLDDTGQWLDLRSAYGAGEAYTNKPRLSMEDSLLGVLIRRRKPLHVENVQTSGHYQNVEVARREGLFSLLSVPLLYGGQAIGALNVYTGTPHRFSNEEIRTLSALGNLSAIAIEKAQLYERLVDMEEQLRNAERLSVLGLLAAEVAHEIRNPLTVMKMLYHSMDLKFPEGDPRTRDAKVMGQKMDHLNKIVEQILDLARHTEPVMASLDLTLLLEDLCLLVRHKLRNHSVELIRQLEPSLPRVDGDATQLEQAFLNLILNAVEAMPKGGKLTIQTELLRMNRVKQTRESKDNTSDTSHPANSTHVAIEFRDTGMGMSPDQKKRIFSSLLQTTKTKGTGLGLAIVSRVVETHQGRIKVHSRLGKGTRIQVILPIKSTASDNVESDAKKVTGGPL